MQVAVNAYLPFGAPATAFGIDEAKKFTGHERDASGLDYMHARYYSAAWGRFLSAGNRWNRALPVLLYDAASDEQVTITVNMVDPGIALTHQLEKRAARTTEHYLMDGRLTFR